MEGGGRRGGRKRITGERVDDLQARRSLRPPRDIVDAGVYRVRPVARAVHDGPVQDEGPRDGGREVVHDEVGRVRVRRLRHRALVRGHGGWFSCFLRLRGGRGVVATDWGGLIVSRVRGAQVWREVSWFYFLVGGLLLWAIFGVGRAPRTTFHRPSRFGRGSRYYSTTTVILGDESLMKHIPFFSFSISL